MKVEDTQANAGSCICPGCPTYNDCMRGSDERLFCGRDKTSCNPSPHGCICGDCPVWSDYSLATYYFCRNGAAT